jgi:hypothetical protein
MGAFVPSGGQREPYLCCETSYWLAAAKFPSLQKSCLHKMYRIMKECCRTDDEQPPKKAKVWLKRAVYAVTSLMFLFILLEQLEF